MPYETIDDYLADLKLRQQHERYNFWKGQKELIESNQFDRAINRLNCWDDSYAESVELCKSHFTSMHLAAA